MMIFNKISLTNKKEVLFVGDLHGAIADFADDIVSKVSNALIFIVGDFGAYSNQMMTMEIFYLEDICRKNDNIVVSIRGNHDDPLLFGESLEKTNKAWSDYLTKILLVDDYTIIETILGNVLCVGGARSVDRALRHKQEMPKSPLAMSQWTEEECVKVLDLTSKLEELDLSIGLEETNQVLIDLKSAKISYVVSHTAPISFTPILISKPFPGCEKDVSMIDEVKVEREYLERLKEVLKANGLLKAWIYGHFHFHSTEEIDGIETRCLNKAIVNPTTHALDYDVYMPR